MDLLGKSKIRQRIILLFAYNPNQAYYINEAARLVKTSAGTAQRELQRLAKDGFLKKERKSNLVYFKINIANPLLAEIRHIIDQTIGLRGILEKELKKERNIDFAFLFGSYAKGELKPDSDIDLYVIGGISEQELYKRIRKVEEKIHREINYHIAEPREFKKNLKKSFFHKEILTKYILIIGDESKFRKFIGWIVKRRQD